MNPRLSNSRLAHLGAHAIHRAFAAFQVRFTTITQRAKARFENRDWHGMLDDAVERLEVYKQIVDQIVAEIRDLLGNRVNQKLVWASIKAVYSGLIDVRNDGELEETFFNSVTRRIFTTIGVDHQIEFVDSDFGTQPTQPAAPFCRAYERAASTATLIEAILTDYRFNVPFEDIRRDARLAASHVEAHLQTLGALQSVERTEMVKAIFFRRKGAYLVGRMFSGVHQLPLVLALVNTPAGIVVDGVLLNDDDISILFSFTRSYFHVDVEKQHDLVRFLKSIMPRKRIAELYIAIGYNKHGKTELYRDLLHHLAHAEEKFKIARGERGMVMVVFTIPAYDVVIKVIKDTFDQPKDTTREAVIAKYRLVFKHDRAGRLVDAQEFEHLKFSRAQFSDELLQELQSVAAASVIVENEHVIIKHCYMERQVIPLNLYLREAGEAAAQAAIIDYGQAIKDLAATNIFPGDLLLKNFGVTRHGRVVFYDYDELCLLTDCHFRVLPEGTTYEEEIAAEPWFAVRENDVFPEEFQHFLGLQGSVREVFMSAHGDLFEAHTWQEVQQRLRQGEVMDILPYDQKRRLAKLQKSFLPDLP